MQTTIQYASNYINLVGIKKGKNITIECRLKSRETILWLVVNESCVGNKLFLELENEHAKQESECASNHVLMVKAKPPKLRQRADLKFVMSTKLLLQQHM